LYFRWPHHSKSDLNLLYADIKPENWQYFSESRPDWQIAAGWLKSRKTEGSVLDIGCFDGAFLESIGPGWGKYGIEISTTAALQAKSRGVTILKNDLEHLNEITMRFDAVSAFDVIEHVEDPRAFLSQMAGLCKPDGVVIISSGNTNALSWKFMGSKYWYCSYDIHISFINEKWAMEAAKKSNLTIELSKRFCHSGNQITLSEKLNDFIKNIFYKISPQLFGLLRRLGFGRINIKKDGVPSDYPPFWKSAKDHIIFFLKNTR